MRLLKVDDLSFEEVPSHGPFPEYAILSHMWLRPSEDEVTLQDLEDSDPQQVRSKAGWQKIEYTVEQARKDGFGFVWIDTCCINKLDPTELTEAINCMFSWYRMAQTCYAYLFDLLWHYDEQSDSSDDYEQSQAKPVVTSSMWFTRGWTLQELIAPKTLAFYDNEWTYLTSRSDIADIIASKTGIAQELLESFELSPRSRHTFRLEQLESYSIAQRMSWAAGRKTTRDEDRAYSLLGLFDIIMPLHYGEGGENAFKRLQQEIIKVSTDQSVFAWKLPKDAQTAPYHEPKDAFLATSPDAFHSRGHIIAGDPADAVAYSLSNIGLEIEILLFQRIEAKRYSGVPFYGALLNCRSIDDPSLAVVLPLLRNPEDRFVVPQRFQCDDIDGSSVWEAAGRQTPIRRKITIQRSRALVKSHKALRRYASPGFVKLRILAGRGIEVASGGAMAVCPVRGWNLNGLTYAPLIDPADVYVTAICLECTYAAAATDGEPRSFQLTIAFSYTSRNVLDLQRDDDNSGVRGMCGRLRAKKGPNLAPKMEMVSRIPGHDFLVVRSCMQKVRGIWGEHWEVRIEILGFRFSETGGIAEALDLSGGSDDRAEEKDGGFGLFARRKSIG